MKTLLLSASLLAMALSLGACTPIGAGITAGSAVGVAAASEGGIQGSLSDTGVTARINDLWFRHDIEMFRRLNMSVNQGRVLITGVVQKPEHRVEAVRLAWQADGVKQVINEVKVADSEGISGWARDNWISARLRSAILFDKDIQGVNYSIDTVQGVVYLMGVSQNQAELDKVIAHAREISYVRDVVSYTKFAGVPLERVVASPANTPANTSAAASGRPVQIPAYQSQGYSQQAYDPAPHNPQPVTQYPVTQPQGTYQDYNYIRDTYPHDSGAAQQNSPYRPQPIPGNEF